MLQHQRIKLVWIGLSTSKSQLAWMLTCLHSHVDPSQFKFAYHIVKCSCFYAIYCKVRNSHYFHSDIYHGHHIKQTQHYWYNTHAPGHQTGQSCIWLQNFPHADLQLRSRSPMIFSVCQNQAQVINLDEIFSLLSKISIQPESVWRITVISEFEWTVLWGELFL